MKELLNNPTLRFIGLFIGLYFLFQQGIKMLLGLEGSGGIFDWLYYQQNIHLLDHFRKILQAATVFLFSLVGETVEVKGWVLQVKGQGAGVSINNTCLGLKIDAVWLSFALSFPMKQKKRWLALLAGLFILTVINIVRISILLKSTASAKDLSFLGFDHHSLFNAVSYIIMLLTGYLLTKESVTSLTNGSAHDVL